MGAGAPTSFLGVLAVFYTIPGGVRNCPGVTATRRLEWRENWLWSEKPACRATSARDRSVPACRSCLARSTRRRMTYWCGGSPVVALNCRAKWQGLRRTTAASCARVGQPSRCSSMYSITARSRPGQPFVTVDADAAVEREVRTDAQEHAAEVAVMHVEVVLPDEAVEQFDMVALLGETDSHAGVLAALENHADARPAVQASEERFHPVFASNHLWAVRRSRPDDRPRRSARTDGSRWTWRGSTRASGR